MIAYGAIGSAGIEGYRITMSSDEEMAEFLEVRKYGRHLEKNRKYIVNTYNSLSKLLDSDKEIKNIDELIKIITNYSKDTNNNCVYAYADWVDKSSIYNCYSRC